MSGFEIVGVVLAVPGILDLLNRIVRAIKDAKDVPKGVLELVESVRTDVERLDQLSKEQADFFADPTVRDSVQGLHDELESLVLGCEAKYLAKKGLLKKVKRIFNGDDVHSHLSRIHQKLQRAYSKWMFEIGLRTSVQVGGLEGRFRILENQIDTKLSEVQNGIRGLRGKQAKQSKTTFPRMYSKRVAPPGAKDDRKNWKTEV